MLKHLYAKNNKENPYIIKSHKLLALVGKCNLELTDEQVEKLQIIIQFNISERYDDYKETFNQKCTEDFKKISNPVVKEVVDTGIKVA